MHPLAATMRVRVLGSAAGGGLPQWNCGCANCVRARRGDPDVPPRAQPSLAVSADGARWSLLNASPDVRDQLARFPASHPRPGTRDVPLDTVVVTNADLDHVLGLLVLRESLPHRIVSTPWVRDAVLEHNAAFRLLEPAWGVAKLDQPIALDREGALEARLFPVPGKVPGWLGTLAANHPEATTAVRLTDQRSHRRLVYAPGVKAFDAGLVAELEAAAVAFVDGTFFRADELARLRPGAPDAHAMGHVPIAGAEGSLPRLAELRARAPLRVLYTHLNNTNPVLDAGSPEAAAVREAGLEVAEDGLELVV
jgi:pyrroloquinoline quinone biosynthesis protein B